MKTICDNVHCICMPMRLALAFGAIWGSAQAQNPVLAPTADVTIFVTAATMRYSSISIPAGVTVRFAQPATTYPPFLLLTYAAIECDGDAVVHGTLSVAGDMQNGYGWPAGLIDDGRGVSGLECQGNLFRSASGGRHSGSYGSVIPFDLRGGSRGGDLDVYDSSCFQWIQTDRGTAGGGTIALHAGGRIEVHGRITADGLHPGYGPAGGGGSGGSILLRGDAGVQVFPTGSVTARGGTIAIPNYVQTNGAPGYVRIDAWGAQPVLQGTVDPAPAVFQMPYLRTGSVLRIGTTWLLDVYAPANAPVFVGVSLQALSTHAATPYGLLGLDLSVAATLGVAAAQPSHDPVATLSMAIPNVPALIGFALYSQGIVVPQALAPRLTNTIGAVIQ